MPTNIFQEKALQLAQSRNALESMLGYDTPKVTLKGNSDLGKYENDSELGLDVTASQRSVDEARAAAQGRFAELGNAIIGGALNIVPTFLDYGASILDAENYGGNTDYHNSISTAMKGISQDINEAFPIYKSSDAGTFSSESLNGMLQSTISSGAAFAALNVLTAGASTAALGSSVAARLITTLGTGLLMTHAEGVGVARDVYDQGVNKLVDNALKDYVAQNPYATQGQIESEYNRLKEDESLKKKAMEGADLAHNINMANVVFNLSGVARILQPSLLSREIAKKAALKGFAKEYALESAQEATEENVNLIAEKAGMALIENKAFELSHAANTVFSKEGFEAALGGVMGAVVQTGVTDAYRGYKGEFKEQNERYEKAKQNENFIKGIISKFDEEKKSFDNTANSVPKQASFETFRKNVQGATEIQADLEKAEAAKDEEMVDFHKNRLLAHFATEAFKLGNGAEFEKVVNMLTGMSSNDIKEAVGTENTDEVRPILGQIKSTFHLAEKVYNEAVTKLPANVVGDYTKLQVEKDLLSKASTSLDTKFNSKAAAQYNTNLQLLMAEGKTQEAQDSFDQLGFAEKTDIVEYRNKKSNISNLLQANELETIALLTTGLNPTERKEKEAELLKAKEAEAKAKEAEKSSKNINNNKVNDSYKAPEELQQDLSDLSNEEEELVNKKQELINAYTTEGISEDDKKAIDKEIENVDIKLAEIKGLKSNKEATLNKNKPVEQVEPDSESLATKYYKSLENEIVEIDSKLQTTKGEDKTKLRKRKRELISLLKENSHLKPSKSSEEKEYVEPKVLPLQNVYLPDSISNEDYFQENFADFSKKIKNISDTELNDLFSEIEKNLLEIKKAFSIFKLDKLKNPTEYYLEDFENLLVLEDFTNKKLSILSDEILKRTLNENEVETEIDENTGIEKYNLRQKELEETFKSYEVDVLDENGTEFSIRQKTYKNLYSDKTQAINRDSFGNIISVTLTDENNNKRTFTEKKLVEEISYIILLSSYVNSKEAILGKQESVDEITEEIQDNINRVEDKNILLRDLYEVEETLDYLDKVIAKEKRILKNNGFTIEEIKELIATSIEYKQREDLLNVQKIIKTKLGNEKPIKPAQKVKSKRTSSLKKLQNSERENKTSGTNGQKITPAETKPVVNNTALNKALNDDLNDYDVSGLENMKKFLERQNNSDYQNRIDEISKKIEAKAKVITTNTGSNTNQANAENSKGTNDIEAKKADIEKRRQEALKVKAEPREATKVETFEAENMNTGEKQLVQIRTTKDGKKEIFMQTEGIQEGRLIWMSLGGKYSEQVSNEILLGFVENPKLIKTQNEQEFLEEQKSNYKGQTIREKINAKYDAELAALEIKTEFNLTDEDLVNYEIVIECK